jgi:DNA-binding response OmpR family regulator
MEGFKTLVCPLPERVLEVVREESPDMIFMDYHLAETESLDILIEIKKDEELKAIPVIMTSGLDRSKECLEAGADRFVMKPFRPTNLVVEIRAVLGSEP